MVDRTAGRQHTFYSDGPPVHVAFGDPYCPRGRPVVADTATALGEPLHPDGTLVVINGPRFLSRAESMWHAAQGWTVVGMTGQPEAGLARELGLCYTALALVTDLDAGVEGSVGVSHAEVLRVFGDNIKRLRGLLRPGRDHGDAWMASLVLRRRIQRRTVRAAPASRTRPRVTARPAG